MNGFAPSDLHGNYKRPKGITINSEYDINNENGQIYLLVGHSCPWCQRTLLVQEIKDLSKKVKVITFNSLTTSLCRKMNSKIILRGLRAVSDFEYEYQLAGMNKKLNNKIETMFLMSDIENQIISSNFVKEIIELGGNIKKFTTPSTIKALKNKYA